MKTVKTETKLSVLSVLSLLVFAPSLTAFAAPSTAVSHPCKEIRAACEAGGYAKGAHKTTGKGLFKDCMKKIMAGETVAGVSVTSDQVSACRARKDKRAARRAAKASSAGATSTQ
jgi:hypothetical protein